MKLKKACYGLVQAPYEWYETVREALLHLGFRQCFADPCCWVLTEEGTPKAIISGHVDDFMMVESPEDEAWTKARKAIQEKFRWGEFELNSFTQCGTHVKRTEEGFELQQERYLDKVQEVPVSQERRKNRKDPCTEKEQSQLRGILGAMSWHASQVGFRFSAYVSLFLSEIPQSTVETILEVNKLLHRMRDAAKEPVKIRDLGPPNETVIMAWTDAASQNRKDGGSTAGIFVGGAHKRILEGQMAEVNPLFWSSSRIHRVCRSPGSAEARAAVDGEDILYLLRYQWSELCGFVPNVRDPDECVGQTPGALVTDSRNVFDRMQQPYISPTGEQKRVDLELLMLKSSQRETSLQIRWVNSQAMLANSLTKRGEDQQCSRYLSLGQRWKIVEDPAMFSGRKRQQQVLDGLDLPEAGGDLRDVECSNHYKPEMMPGMQVRRTQAIMRDGKQPPVSQLHRP